MKIQLWYPWVLWFFPLILVLVCIILRYLMTIKSYMLLLSTPAHCSLLIKNVSWKRIVFRSTIFLCVSVFLWLALTRPYVVEDDAKLQDTTEYGRDVVIALDVSRSMLASDGKPTRLELAKNKIKRLLQRLTSERVGLIIFSGTALIQCPLTKDFDAFLMFLQAVDAETVSSGTTSLESALATSIKFFKTGPDKVGKLVVLYTDGEDFSSNLANIKDEVKKMSISIATVGVGSTAGAPIPWYHANGTLGGYQKDASDTIVMSRLGESLLKEMAKDLSGMYVRADESSDSDIEAICTWVRSFDKERFSVLNHKVQHECYMYGSGLAFILLLLQWFL